MSDGATLLPTTAKVLVDVGDTLASPPRRQPAAAWTSVSTHFDEVFHRRLGRRSGRIVPACAGSTPDERVFVMVLAHYLSDQ